MNLAKRDSVTDSVVRQGQWQHPGIYVSPVIAVRDGARVEVCALETHVIPCAPSGRPLRGQGRWHTNVLESECGDEGEEVAMSEVEDAGETTKEEARKPITYRQLKEKIDALSEEQLDMQVVWLGDECGGKVVALDVLEENWIDPEGDGLCPESSYKESFDEAEEGQSWEEYVKGAQHFLKKGTPIIDCE